MHDTKQIYYNQIKGRISEILDVDNFPSVVIEVGHENKRFANIIVKKEMMKNIISNFKVGDIIAFRYFLSSRLKHGRWYTMANALEIVE
jgi:hypothetical protein